MEHEFTDVETPEQIRRRKRGRALLIAAMLLALAAAFVFFLLNRKTAPADNGSSSRPTVIHVPAPEADFDGLAVWFIDVGQGDCALLRAPDGKTMLVDAGPAGSFGRIKYTLDQLGVTRIDLLVASHLHDDHIGGMREVVEHYEVGAFLLPPFDIESNAYAALIAALDEANVPATPMFATATSTVAWSDDPRVEVRVLAPYDVTYTDDNDTSLMLRVSLGKNAVLLAGDATAVSERLALKALPNRFFHASVLKVGHHGSSTSTGKKFLKTVHPAVAVISVGTSNTYGLPDGEVIERLKEVGALVLRTDEDGTVLILLDETQTEVIESP